MRARSSSRDPADGAEQREGLVYISARGDLGWKTLPYQDFAMAAIIFDNDSASLVSITSAGECE